MSKEANMTNSKDEPQKDKKEAPLNAKEEATEFAKTLLFAFAIALIIRMFLFEPFNIPSGSMKPTLLVGDYLITSKPAYGYGQYTFSLFLKSYIPAPFEGRIFARPPKRGDIAVFFVPYAGDNYIKRVVGMPGDTIQMKRGRLYINDKLIPREPVGLHQEEDGETLIEYLETLPDGVIHRIYERSDDEVLDNTDVYTVPEDHYFMMGDNRDNSQDSRIVNGVGYVAFENIVGRADRIFFSENGTAHIWEIWKWPGAIRYGRIFENLQPVRSPQKQ